MHRYTPRTTRLALAVFAASGLTALGCSLIVDFEESRIPAEDVGVLDTGALPIDTGTAPIDTGAPDTTIEDTGAPDVGDTGAAEAGDTSAPDTTSGDTGTPDTGAPDTEMDTGTPDTGAPDTEMDTGTPDTGAVTDSADAADTAADDAAEAGPSTMTFSTQLTPSQEVPATTSTASGSATCVLTIATKSLACTVTHTVSAPSGAHIHDAAAGRNGAIAHDLGAAASPISQTVTLSDADVTKLTNGGFYINIHDTPFPAGAIRGQLLKSGETLYGADIKAAPSVTTSGAGGFGMIRRTSGAFDYSGEVKNLNAATTEAHIHKASDESVVTGLTTPTQTAASTTFAGTLASTALELTLLDAAAYYVNVHTDATGGGTAAGEVRGTLNKIFTAP